MSSFIYLYFLCWIKIFNFWGRSSRREFLVFNLVNLALLTLAGFLYNHLTTFDVGWWTLKHFWRELLSWQAIKNVFNYGINFGIPLIISYIIFSLVYSLAFFTLSIRRLHDINRSGAYTFLLVIPIIGWIAALVLYLKKGSPTTNKYGPPPSS